MKYKVAVQGFLLGLLAGVLTAALTGSFVTWVAVGVAIGMLLAAGRIWHPRIARRLQPNARISHGTGGER